MKSVKIVGRVAIVLFDIVLLILISLYSIMLVICKGPSYSAAELFVRSVRETSAVGFLANIFFSDEEIAAIEAITEESVYVATDTSLVRIGDEAITDEYGLTDEDGDGIILVDIKGSSYVGYMLVVLDPSRVEMGVSEFGKTSYPVAEMAERYGAVACINGGGFLDEYGSGDGTCPKGMTIVDGEVFYDEGISHSFVGFDYNHVLHTGIMSKKTAVENNIKCGVSFGPSLIINGEMASAESLRSGLNPRTAIGQRADGAVLLLVIDGRQVSSLGADYQDLADIMLKYGAVNACNLDGGSSSLMWYEDRYLNNGAVLVGIRPVSTSFVVMPKEEVK